MPKREEPVTFRARGVTASLTVKDLPTSIVRDPDGFKLAFSKDLPGG